MAVLGVSAYKLLRGQNTDVFLRSAQIVLPITCVAALVTAGTGHGQGVLMTEQQPKKMAAAEALYETEKGAGFSFFATGDWERNPGELNRDVRVPHLLSILGTNSWNGEVEGINDIQRDSVEKFGPGDYVPAVWVSYWSFRLMIGAGTLVILLTAAGIWLARRSKLEQSRLFLKLAVPAAILPLVANWMGWIFTEMARQPWVVYGLLKTSDARSPEVGSAEIVITLTGFTLIYGVLAAFGGWIAWKHIKHGPEEASSPDDDGDGTGGGEPPSQTPVRDLAIAY
jgi:cytochrome d ubiquinol oxidase subunit I